MHNLGVAALIIKFSNQVNIRMNRIRYITELANAHFSMSDDHNTIYALIMALTPKQACSFFDLKFEQNYKIRQWTARKISHDLKTEYLPCHQDLFSTMIDMINQKPFKKRDSCAYAIDTMCDSLPPEQGDMAIKTFLASPYIRVRRRAYKRLLRDWDQRYQENVRLNWDKFQDRECIGIILKHFSVDYLLLHYKEFLDYSEPYQLSKLFIKISSRKPNKVKELKHLDEISYAYALTKLEKKLTHSEAKQFLHNNYSDSRIGLLIWCFGQMGLWNAIVDFEENYKEKIRKLRWQ